MILRTAPAAIVRLQRYCLTDIDGVGPFNKSGFANSSGGTCDHIDGETLSVKAYLTVSDYSACYFLRTALAFSIW